MYMTLAIIDFWCPIITLTSLERVASKRKANGLRDESFDEKQMAICSKVRFSVDGSFR